MKVHKQGKKANLVCDMVELQQIAVALTESPVLQVRKLAFKLAQAMNEMAERESKK